MSAVPKAVVGHAIAPRASGRPWTFYVLLAVFVFDQPLPSMGQ